MLEDVIQSQPSLVESRKTIFCRWSDNDRTLYHDCATLGLVSYNDNRINLKFDD